MPLKSKAQLRFLMTKRPKLAREFAVKTPSIKALPDRVADATSWGDQKGK